MKTIKEALDFAQSITAKKGIFIPLFIGNRTVSYQSCQQWAKEQDDFGFIDLNIHRMENYFNEMPKIEVENMSYKLPEFWPTSGKGLILLEEPNRVPLNISQYLVRLLTDRKMFNYELTSDWTIAAYINNTEFDALSFDPIVRSRFIEIDVRHQINCTT